MSRTYGKWNPVKTLTEGGQAQILLVEDKTDPAGPRAALKAWKNRARIDRFAREVDVTSNLDHPHIIRLIDRNLDIAHPYLVMEYCKRGNFEEAGVRSLPLVERLRLLAKVAGAVGFAHEKGIVHRDLKPQNLLVRDNGEPVVTDFGICFTQDESARLTVPDEQVGARFYMAPELEGGGPGTSVTAAADVYSLGKVLYWLATGRHLPREKHREATDGWDVSGKPGMPWVYEILDKCLGQDPTERLANGKELSEHLMRAAVLIEKGAHFLDLGVEQECDFCREGRYLFLEAGETVQQRSDTVRSFGFNAVGSITGELGLRVLVCDECGHVRLFRPDLRRGNPRPNWLVPGSSRWKSRAQKA
jgi:serine/threonine protein kinase